MFCICLVLFSIVPHCNNLFFWNADQNIVLKNSIDTSALPCTHYDDNSTVSSKTFDCSHTNSAVTWTYIELHKMVVNCWGFRILRHLGSSLTFECLSLLQPKFPFPSSPLAGGCIIDSHLWQSICSCLLSALANVFWQLLKPASIFYWELKLCMWNVGSGTVCVHRCLQLCVRGGTRCKMQCVVK